jgi:hypothetical protein
MPAHAQVERKPAPPEGRLVNACFAGLRGLVGAGVVRDEESLSGPNVGDLVQYRRNTKHELSKAYWNRLFDFADAYFAQRR